MLVADGESCGRGVWDSNKAKDPINPRVFKQPSGIVEVSVDRLDLADMNVLIELHDKERGEDKPFKGWGVLSAAQARSINCEVIEDIRPDNPWHANIVMPAVDEDMTKQILNSLATMARWRAR